MKSVFCSLYNKSVRYMWTIGCVGLGVLPVLVGVCIYIMNVNSFHRQTVQNNETMMMQMYGLAEKAFNNISNIAYDVTSDNYLNEYLAARDASERIIVKMKMQNWLSSKRDGSLYVAEAGIYFPETDEIVTDATAAPLEIFCFSTFDENSLDAERMRERLMAIETQDLMLVRDRQGNPSLMYLRKGTVRSKKTAVVFIRLDNAILNTMIENVKKYTFCDMNFLLHNSGEFLYPASEQMEKFRQERKEFYPISRIRQSTLGTKTVFSYISFDYLQLTMILCTPWRMFGYEMTRINIYFLTGLFILLLGSTGLTIFFIRTNYKPVKELLNLASDAGYLASLEYQKGSLNEYDILKEALSSSQDENKNMKELILAQEKELKQSVFVLLLQNSGQVLNKPRYRELLRDSFPFDFFCAAELAIEETIGNELLPGEEELRFCLSMIIDPYESVRCFLLLRDAKHMIFLFNLSKEEAGEDFVRQIIKELLAELKRRRQTEKDIAVYSVSTVHRGIGKISEAYREAEYALRYRLIFGDNLQNERRSNAALALTKSFYYSEDEERRISNAIIDGKTEYAENIFKEIWKRNTQERNIPSEYLVFLLFDVAGTVIRTGNMVPLQEDISEYILERTKEMMQNQSPDRLYHNTLLLIHEVSSAYEKEHSRSSDRLKQKVLNYIETNYADPNLSVEAISEAFGRSRSSLFQLFKDETGNSLLYYINKVRIFHAQEMLEHTDKTINRIAEETGFTSGVSFARVFKKYTQMTPGKYRERYKKQK